MYNVCKVVLPYMSDQDSQALKYWISSSFRYGVLCFFEPIAFGSDHETDPFGDAMLDHYQNSVKSPLYTTELYPGIQNQRCRFEKGGFDNVTFTLGPQVLDSWISKEDVARVALLEPFDEFEIWRVYLRHCLVGFATTNQDNGLFQRMGSYMESICLGPAFIDIIQSVAAPLNLCRHESENLEPNIHNTDLQKQPQPSFRNEDGRLDPFSGVCKWHTMPHHVKRAGACAAVSWDGTLLFTIGGIEVGGIRMEDMIISGLNDSSSIVCKISSPHHHLVHSSAVAIQKPNGILVFGGRSSPKKASNSVVFISAGEEDLGTQSVFYVSEDQDSDRLGPPKRYRHTANRIVIEGEERMIVFGGRTTDGEPLDDVWTFSPARAVWQQLIPKQGSGPSARHSHSSEVNNGVLYVYGGLDGAAEAIGDFWAFDPEFCDWRKIGDLPSVFGHRMVSIDRDFVFGGRMWLVVGGVRGNGGAVQEPFIIRKSRDPPHPECVEVYEEQRSAVHIDHRNYREWFSFGGAICSHTPTPDPHGTTDIFCSGGGGGLFSFGHRFNNEVRKISLQLRPKM